MKKLFILPLFMAIALVSLAWGAYTVCTGEYAGYCKWDACSAIAIEPGESWSKATCEEAYNNCVENGYLYTDDACVTWSGIGNNPSLSGKWCQWTTGCQPIKNETELTNCETNGSVYTEVSPSDVGEGKTCGNSGTWTGEGKNPNAVPLGCCNWDGNGCFKVFEASQWADCAAGYRYATCPGDEAGTCTGSPLAPPSSSSTQSSFSASSSSSSSSSSTPSSSSAVSSSSSVGTSSSSSDDNTIISYNSAPVIGLNVVHFARSLRIASDKDAKISLFDIRGKQILSQKVQSGTTTINLEKQKLGVYYAVVRSGSQKQMVKIVLK